MTDPYNLQRFVDAQAPVYPRVLVELRAGQKQTHWMWFVFPQIAGLGSSPMAQKFAIASLAEAQAYLAHEVLGPRLQECTRLVIAAAGRRPLGEILGYPDDLKFRSSMTLFARAAVTEDSVQEESVPEDSGPEGSVFGQALRAFFNGAPDARTLELLRISS